MWKKFISKRSLDSHRQNQKHIFDKASSVINTTSCIICCITIMYSPMSCINYLLSQNNLCSYVVLSVILSFCFKVYVKVKYPFCSMEFYEVLAVCQNFGLDNFFPFMLWEVGKFLNLNIKCNINFKKILHFCTFFCISNTFTFIKHISNFLIKKYWKFQICY